MSFGIDAKKLKTIIDLYHPENSGQELKYMIHLKGEEELFRNLQTCPFQGISQNSIEDRELAFGKNKLSLRNVSIAKIFIKALNEHYIYLPILISILLLVYRLFSVLIEDKNIHECVFLLLTALSNWGLRALQQLYLKYKWSKTDVQINESICTVVRQNKKQVINGTQLTVGDILQFKQGEIIPADGWLIQGLDVRIVQQYLSQLVQVQKDTLRKCILDIKGAVQKNGAINERTIELDQIISYKSPVLVSGSTVKSGQGRMIVLCVGKTSKRGQFLTLSRQKLKQNIVKSKISKLLKAIFSSLLIVSILYVIIFICQTILKALGNHSQQDLLKLRSWINIEFFIIIIAVGIPQGMQLAIITSLTFIKVRLWFKQQIWVNYCEDITKMAAVTQICYDREKTWDRVEYLEWWNEEKILFQKENQGYQQLQKQNAQISQQNQLQQMDFHSYFKQIMKIGIKFKYSQHSQYQSLSTSAQKMQNKINNWEIFKQSIDDNCFYYICDKKAIKYVTMKHQNKNRNGTIVFFKAEAHQILQLCSKMLIKSTGQMRTFSKLFLRQIEEVIKLMNKKMANTYGISYCICENGQIQTQIQLIKQRQMNLLCLVGVGNKKDYTDYQIIRKLKQSGIKLILASSKSLPQSINRSKDIGINTLEEDNLAMEGEDLIKIIGGIICFKCKKNFCICQKTQHYNPKIKNLQQFRRITKYFKVMANATYFHKYSLIIAYRNINKYVAYLGVENQDNPAQTNSYLSISSTISNANLGNSQVQFPNNSIKCLYNFIIWSRFSSQVISKIIQLIFPANIVPIIIIILSAVIFQTASFSIIQILWVSVYICFLTSLNLSWQKPKENIMEQSSKSFDKESSLLTEPVKKQIVFQCIFQSIILFLMLAFGHQFLPESLDKVDDLIGTNWQAKYSSIQMNKVASGLYKNNLVPAYSYEHTFNTYGIYSRHLTIVFNTYALMQIFNYFNCRKIGTKQINILQGIEFHNILLFIMILVTHYVFLGLGSDYVNLYPANLNIKQWLISLGLALIVEILAFIIRLLPDSSKERSSKHGWANKSYNLSIKLVGKSDRFYQFDREEDILFKNH